MAASVSYGIAIPAWNCADTIDELIVRLNGLERDLSIFVVDDHSSDDTLVRAKQHKNVTVVRNPENRGYGGTSKRLYELTRDAGVEFVINVHGDLGPRPRGCPADHSRIRVVKSGFCLWIASSLYRRPAQAAQAAAVLRSSTSGSDAVGASVWPFWPDFCAEPPLWSEVEILPRGLCAGRHPS